jgi:hypothetical protein
LKKYLCALALSALTAVPAASQTPLVPNAAAAQTMLRAGMAIPMKTMVELTTNGKTMVVGQRAA